MVAPFINISTNKLKPGKFEAYQQQFLPDLLGVVESHEPRLLAFNIFANDEGTEIAGVQVHPDADSMLHHLQLMRERITMAYGEYLEATTAIEVYGPPNDAVLEVIKMMATPGVSVRVKPRHLGGFTRLQPK